MKTSERHHLKDNELVMALGAVQGWLNENQQTLLAALAVVGVIGGGVGGYMAWKGSVDGKARAMLASAMVVAESPVQPPAPPAGTTNDPANAGGQAPGTYPTEAAKNEAALPKFMAAAEAYPNTDSGQLARYYAANTLVAMGRTDEAMAEYDKLIAGTGVVAQMAKLGKAQAQIVAKQFDPAIATMKAMSEQATPGPVPVDAVLMELARAYTLAGKPEDAKKAYTQVVEQHADSVFATEARAELDKAKS